MANKYVRSAAAGAGTGADWANAYTTLTLAIAGSAAGDDLWVAADHAESTASAITLTFPGTAASPNRVLCVDHTGTVPPVAADLRTTATVSTTGASNIISQGNFYVYGITFNAGSSTNAASIIFTSGSSCEAFCSNCKFVLNNTSASSIILLGGSANARAAFVWSNSSATFGATGQGIRTDRCMFRWENTSAPLLGTMPTTLFAATTDAAGRATLDGLDLSAFSGTLFAAGTANQPYLNIVKDCKLHASVTIAATPTAWIGAETFVVRSASSGIAYTQTKINGAGTETIETTIVRSGGAVVNGTAIAKKYVTTARAFVWQPFIATPIAVANNIVGANVTVSVYGVWGGGAVPTNADIWFDVYYLGSSATPLATIVSTGKATVLTTASNHSADAASTWGGSTTKFIMSTTLSAPQPAMRGEMYIRIYCGAASTTFYIHPKVVLS